MGKKLNIALGVGLTVGVLGSEAGVGYLMYGDGVKQGVEQGAANCNNHLTSNPIGHLALKQAEADTLAGVTGDNFTNELNGLNPQFTQALATAGMKQVLISEVRHTAANPAQTDATNTYNLQLDNEASALGAGIHDYQTQKNPTSTTAINYDFTRPDLVGDPGVALDIYLLQLGCNQA